MAPAHDIDAQYCPAGHAVGADRPAVAHTWPAGHAVKFADPAGQYVPRGHAMLSLDSLDGQ